MGMGMWLGGLWIGYLKEGKKFPKVTTGIVATLWEVR